MFSNDMTLTVPTLSLAATSARLCSFRNFSNQLKLSALNTSSACMRPAEADTIKSFLFCIPRGAYRRYDSFQR